MLDLARDVEAGLTLVRGQTLPVDPLGSIG